MKFIRSKIFYFTLGAIIFSSITAIAVTAITADKVTYTKQDGSETDVNTALNDLYTTQNTTISDLQTQLTKFSNILVPIYIDVNNITFFRVSDIKSKFSYYKVVLTSNTGATCKVDGISVADGWSTVYNVSNNTDYETNNEFSDFRLKMSASGSSGYCNWRIYLHN